MQDLFHQQYVLHFRPPFILLAVSLQSDSCVDANSTQTENTHQMLIRHVKVTKKEWCRVSWRCPNVKYMSLRSRSIDSVLWCLVFQGLVNKIIGEGYRVSLEIRQATSFDTCQVKISMIFQLSEYAFCCLIVIQYKRHNYNRYTKPVQKALLINGIQGPFCWIQSQFYAVIVVTSCWYPVVLTKHQATSHPTGSFLKSCTVWKKTTMNEDVSPI